MKFNHSVILQRLSFKHKLRPKSFKLFMHLARKGRGILPPVSFDRAGPPVLGGSLRRKAPLSFKKNI